MNNDHAVCIITLFAVSVTFNVVDNIEEQFVVSQSINKSAQLKDETGVGP